MGQFFKVEFFGPDDEVAKLFAEPDERSESKNLFPYLLKIPHEGDSEEWVYIENHESDSGAPQGKGWIKTWAVGEPLPSLAVEVAGESLTLAAIRHELEAASDVTTAIAADYFIALFLLENQVDLSNPPTSDDAPYPVNSANVTPDLKSAFSVGTMQWSAFLTEQGDKLKGWKAYHREIPLAQLRCAVWLAKKSIVELGVIRGGSLEEPFIPRLLDVFMAHLIGAKAAAEVIRMEAEDDGLNRNIKTILRNVNGWNDETPELRALFADRAAYLGPFSPTGGTTGGMTSVADFLEVCRGALKPALQYAAQMIELYVPGFAVNMTPSAETWMREAETELQKWTDGGWVEQTDPGLSTAKEYFKATSYPFGDVGIGADNELTHWCGAFVAHCMKEAGQKVPMGAAAAAKWREWGDASIRWRGQTDVPVGAVAMTAGNSGTSRISHVNFIADWQGDDDHYMGLGGNQSDSVTIAPFPKDEIADIRVLSDISQSSDGDAEVLAKTLYGEIRGGSEEQVDNVAQVVLNRYLAGYRSNGSISGVCLAPFQFSCWNPGTSARSQLEALDGSNARYAELLGVAKQVIASRLANPDAEQPLQGARHYHNYFVNPNWAEPAKIVEKDGLHIFYRGIA
ncbi:MAG: cell wall hydrolase [Pseudomonadota bacterium]